MKFFAKRKDGGPESHVTGYWLIEIKSLFSVVLLRFDHGSREAYHSHAFNAVSWVLRGKLLESLLGDRGDIKYLPSWRPVWTPRTRFHKVISSGTTWVLSIRGPWAKHWMEYIPGKEVLELTHGRRTTWSALEQ